MNYLATSGLLKFDPATLTALIDITLKEDGYLEFVVTGPEEVIIDQLIKTTKNYLELIVRPDIDLLATHFLTFSETTKEVVKDPTVTLLRNKIESEILIIKDKIAVLNQTIDTAFEESQKPSDIEISSLQKQSRLSLKKNIILGLFVGLVLSIVVAVVRYHRQIVWTDISGISQEWRLTYLGSVPFLSPIAKQKSKRFGNVIDKLIVKLFDLSYDPTAATKKTEYVAQVLRGALDGKKNFDDFSHSANILVPYVEGDSIAETLVMCISQILQEDNEFQQVNLLAGASLEQDPDTIEAARESFGILLLAKPTNNISDLENSIRRSIDLSKKIIGVLELEERW
jgi:uncharacterized protein YdcH (DUF465 family)